MQGFAIRVVLGLSDGAGGGEGGGVGGGWGHMCGVCALKNEKST